MRIGRTEQWLLLAVMLAAAGWVLMLVYARISRPAEASATAMVADTDTGTATATVTDTDTNTDTATATSTPTVASEMVFSEADLATTAQPASTAPAVTAAPATANGRSPTIVVASEPSGARIMEDGVVIGRTPMPLPRPTDAARYLIIAKTGYRSIRIALTPTSQERISVTLRPPEP